MSRCAGIAAIVVVVIAAACRPAAAAEKVPNSHPGVMLSVEKKSHERTQYYIVNTPVTTE